VRERPILFSDAMVRAILDGRKTQTRRILKPQPPSEVETRVAGADYGLDPRVKRGIGMYSLNDYERLPKEPGVFDVSGSVGFVRDRCGQTEWRCPYGVPGDRLWVREAWALEALGDDSERVVWRPNLAAAWVEERERLGEVFYLEWDYRPERWRPSIHMPRWASRLTLEITDIRVERLQRLQTWTAETEADVLAEGLTFVEDSPGQILPKQYGLPGRMLSRTPWCAFQNLWDEINSDRAPWASNPWVWVIQFRRLP